MAKVVTKGINLFKKGIFPVYKEAHVTNAELIKWIKLTLQFENPSNKSIWFNIYPKYFDWYLTGVRIIGFGLHAQQVFSLGRYMQREWLISALLGRETLDYHSSSPLLAEYEYRHITPERIKEALNKFIGEIQQVSPPSLLENVENKPTQGDDLISMTSFQSDDIGCDNRNDDDERAIAEKWSKQTMYIDRKREKFIVNKQCHSIDLLELDDALCRFRIISDGFFNCRAFVHDLGIELGCHAVIHQQNLSRLGPFNDKQALHKHELHIKQIIESIEEHRQIADQYIEDLRRQYPWAKKQRFI